jgi:hypothetical protein
VSRIKKIGQSIKTVTGEPESRFVPGWDKGPASQQQAPRIARRNAQGQKMTPINRKIPAR